MSDTDSNLPADQGENYKVGPGKPPLETRFKDGVSGNPKGRPRAGAAVIEHIDAMAEYTEEQLRMVARDKKVTWTKRTAAERMLRSLEAGDIADFSGLLRGENNLDDLRAMGINTEVVKKFKQKTRRVPNADGKVIEEVVDREIELHDRAGADFDRIIDRTEGRPTQAIKIDGSLELGNDSVLGVARLLAGMSLQKAIAPEAK